METIRNVLLQGGVQLAQTVYDDSPMLDFPITAVGKWAVVRENMERDTFCKIKNYRDCIKDGKSEEEYKNLCTAIANAPIEDKRGLREHKKKLDADIKHTAFTRFFPEADTDTPVYYVSYMERLLTADFNELSALVPAWQGEAYEKLHSYPWFVGDIEKLGQLLSSKNEVAIEGGSCLLGNDEMLFHFRMKDGTPRLFDFNTMQEIHKSTEELTEKITMELWDFVSEHAGEIAEVKVECPKSKITVDEYEMTENLFLLATGLNAKLVITIPDFSYEKTFLQIFGELDKTVFEPLAEEYRREVARVKEASLNMIECVRRKYQYDDVVVFHGGKPELLKVFSQNRDRFIGEFTQKHSYAERNLTNRKVTQQALIDYICMPAMPFYLWGVKDVIEVNRLEEYPAVNKCKRIHKNEMNLHTMLFPQRVSPNKRTSSFYADRKNKEYVDEELFRADSTP